MKPNELNEAIKAKKAQLEAAEEAGASPEEISAIYKELKELQYQKVQAELGAKESGSE